ncbi:MAG: HIT family protein [Chitinophagaceae bacterium]
MTLFSKIIAGDIPSYKIAENDLYFAFLDIFPAAEGHTLVVPKIEVDRIFDLPTQYLAGMLLFAQPIAKAIQQAYPCDRVNILTLGFEVPHTHIHLLPMNSMADAALMNNKKAASAEALAAAQEKIQSFLQA